MMGHTKPHGPIVPAARFRWLAVVSGEEQTRRVGSPTGAGRVFFPAEPAGSLVHPLRRLVQSPDRTVAAMELATDASVLEVGSGPGFFSPSISRAVPDGWLVLVDLQVEMLLAARTRLADATNVAFVQADVCTLPVGGVRFDVVFLATMLGEVPDQAAAVREMRRVLRPNGSVVVAETRRDSDFIPLRALRSLFERHGFEYLNRSGMAWQYTARFRLTDSA
jgi:ubiquinone/menaquinone biosynthesis C-methylase UbiE